jgi:very-short-patch-repair endonuclease
MERGEESGRRYVRIRKRGSVKAGATAVKTLSARNLRREMTSAETALWSTLRRNGLGVPCRRQHVIAGWIVDFYVPAASLVIEIDGGIHARQIEYDRERDRVMRTMGLDIIRIKNEEIVDNIEEVLARLRTHFETRLRRPLP